MKILLIGASHGNELLGITFYQYLLNKKSTLVECVDFVLGNPSAYAKQVRYTESDLNRCYQDFSSDDYEHRRAIQITKYIEMMQPDIILDMHTTRCIQAPCLITSAKHKDIKSRFMRACHISKVVIMPDGNDICSLIDNAIGYEIQYDTITTTMLHQIEQDLKRFIDGSGTYSSKTLFEIDAKILKQDVGKLDITELINFEMSSYGFVPFLVGENSYKKQTDYIGFKAGASREIEV